jgi:hypothetical protein
MTFPVRHAHGNILIGPDGDRAALYRVQTVSYPFLADTDKVAWYRRLTRFAHGVEQDFSVWRVCRGYPSGEYVDRASHLCDTRRQDPQVWRDFLRGHQEHLQRAEPFTAEVYVAVRLPGERQVAERLMRAADRLNPWRSRARTQPLTTPDIVGLEAAEQHTHGRVTASFPARRATTREIQWLLKRAGCRGLCEPWLDEHWAPAALQTDATVEPLETDVWKFANAPLREQNRALHVQAEEGDTYQAMLALGALPVTSEFPGSTELLCTRLEDLWFPVDVVLHARWIPNRDAATLVKRRVLDADNRAREEEVSAHGSLSYAAHENRELVRELDDHLQEPGHPPLLKVSTLFAVGAATVDELEVRVEALRHQYGQVKLHRPLGLQAQMFLDHLPRPDTGRARAYTDVYTVMQFASLMMLGTHETGAQEGALLGNVATGGRRPVLNDATEAPRTGHAPSIMLTGTLGSGKTVAAQLIAYHAERRGSVVIDVDPKPDHNLEGLPELAGRVRVIELSGDEKYRGLLDPLMVAPPSMREDRAHAFLMDLLPTVPATWETQIRKAVKHVATGPDPCCVGVLEHLLTADNRDAVEAGEAIAVWSDSGIARLGFGNGWSSNGHQTPVMPVTTIKANALSLPDENTRRADYDPAERLAVAVLKLVATYAMRLVQGNRETHKIVLFDEAWFLLNTQDGRRLLDRLNHMGRAENATLILATQQVADIGDIDGLIGTRMIFRQENENEARRALALIGLDPDDRALAQRVMAFPAGRCLMRYFDGRIAEVQIDPVYPHLLELWDTTPGARAIA